MEQGKTHGSHLTQQLANPMSQNKSVEEVVEEFIQQFLPTDLDERLEDYTAEELKQETWSIRAYAIRNKLTKLLQQERQTSQEREREIVEEILRRIDPKIAQTAHGEALLEDVVDDIKVVAQKYNITLTNPNKD